MPINCTKKVCYLDGQSKERVLAILNKHGKLILNDGMSQFAVASHAISDEFFIRKYKVIDIYSNDPSQNTELMKKYGVRQTFSLTTVWDTFSHSNPGTVRRIKIRGIDIYDVYDELVKLGMYEAKIIED